MAVIEKAEESPPEGAENDNILDPDDPNFNPEFNPDNGSEGEEEADDTVEDSPIKWRKKKKHYHFGIYWALPFFAAGLLLPWLVGWCHMSSVWIYTIGAWCYLLPTRTGAHPSPIGTSVRLVGTVLLAMLSFIAMLSFMSIAFGPNTSQNMFSESAGVIATFICVALSVAYAYLLAKSSKSTISALSWCIPPEEEDPEEDLNMGPFPSERVLFKESGDVEFINQGLTDPSHDRVKRKITKDWRTYGFVFWCCVFMFMTYEVCSIARRAFEYAPEKSQEYTVTNSKGHKAKVHAWCTGSGSPTIVAEHGLAGTGQDFTWVEKKLNSTYRFCTFDRAGYGWSHLGKDHRNVENWVHEMSTLLPELNVSDPFVYVGHQFASVSMRYYHHRFGKNTSDTNSPSVAAMVMVDPVNPDHFSGCGSKYRYRGYMWLTAMSQMMGLSMGRVLLQMGKSISTFDFYEVHDLPKEVHKEYLNNVAKPQNFATASFEWRRLDESCDILDSVENSLGSLPLVVVSAGDGIKYESAVYHPQIAQLSTRGIVVDVPEAGIFSILHKESYADVVSQSVIDAVVLTSPSSSPSVTPSPSVSPSVSASISASVPEERRVSGIMQMAGASVGDWQAGSATQTAFKAALANVLQVSPTTVFISSVGSYKKSNGVTVSFYITVILTTTTMGLRNATEIEQDLSNFNTTSFDEQLAHEFSVLAITNTTITTINVNSLSGISNVNVPSQSASVTPFPSPSPVWQEYAVSGSLELMGISTSDFGTPQATALGDVMASTLGQTVYTENVTVALPASNITGGVTTNYTVLVSGNPEHINFTAIQSTLVAMAIDDDNNNTDPDDELVTFSTALESAYNASSLSYGITSLVFDQDVQISCATGWHSFVDGSCSACDTDYDIKVEICHACTGAGIAACTDATCATGFYNYVAGGSCTKCDGSSDNSVGVGLASCEDCTGAGAVACISGTCATGFVPGSYVAGGNCTACDTGSDASLGSCTQCTGPGASNCVVAVCAAGYVDYTPGGSCGAIPTATPTSTPTPILTVTATATPTPTVVNATA